MEHGQTFGEMYLSWRLWATVCSRANGGLDFAIADNQDTVRLLATIQMQKYCVKPIFVAWTLGYIDWYT